MFSGLARYRKEQRGRCYMERLGREMTTGMRVGDGYWLGGRWTYDPISSMRKDRRHAHRCMTSVRRFVLHKVELDLCDGRNREIVREVWWCLSR